MWRSTLGVRAATRDALVAPLHPEPPHLRVERLPRDPEAPRRGALRRLLLEPPADQRGLDACEDAGEGLVVAERVGVADATGEVVAADRASLPDREDEPVDLVLELAHVPRPRVRLERAQRLGLEARGLAALAALEVLAEVRDERRDVGHPVAERRDADREDGEPVVEVEPEATRLRLRFERAVRRRDHARPHAPHAIGA